MSGTKAQIIATLGPSSMDVETLMSMARSGMDVARLNFSWGNDKERAEQASAVREAAKKIGKKIPIIADIPGPRINLSSGHGFDPNSSILSSEDEAHVRFAVAQGMEYIAASFIAKAEDISLYKALVRKYGGNQPIIAKIERKEALENIDAIIKEADAVMIARGDLGKNIPIEELPFAQAAIIRAANMAGKPVITATEMLLSMTENPVPTRAEVTDVANAILQGTDAVMLSEETARGKYPIETVAMMEKIALGAEKHTKSRSKHHL